MMEPTRVTYPWKMLFWLFLVILLGVILVSFCYAQSPTPSLPGTMPNHGTPGSVGGPVMVIPPTGSPTFIYPMPPAVTAPAMVPPSPVMIIPPVGMPTFVYPGLAQ